MCAYYLQTVCGSRNKDLPHIRKSWTCDFSQVEKGPMQVSFDAKSTLTRRARFVQKALPIYFDTDPRGSLFGCG